MHYYLLVKSIKKALEEDLAQLRKIVHILEMYNKYNHYYIEKHYVPLSSYYDSIRPTFILIIGYIMMLIITPLYLCGNNTIIEYCFKLGVFVFIYLIFIKLVSLIIDLINRLAFNKNDIIPNIKNLTVIPYFSKNIPYHRLIKTKGKKISDSLFLLIIPLFILTIIVSIKTNFYDIIYLLIGYIFLIISLAFIHDMLMIISQFRKARIYPDYKDLLEYLENINNAQFKELQNKLNVFKNKEGTFDNSTDNDGILLLQSIALLGQEDYEKALEYLNYLMFIEKDGLKFIKGICLYHLGKYEEALNIFNEIKVEGNKYIIIYKGLIHFYLNNYQKSYDLLSTTYTYDIEISHMIKEYMNNLKLLMT